MELTLFYFLSFEFILQYRVTEEDRVT